MLEELRHCRSVDQERGAAVTVQEVFSESVCVGWGHTSVWSGVRCCSPLTPSLPLQVRQLV